MKNSQDAQLHSGHEWSQWNTFTRSQELEPKCIEWVSDEALSQNRFLHSLNPNPPNHGFSISRSESSILYSVADPGFELSPRGANSKRWAWKAIIRPISPSPKTEWKRKKLHPQGARVPGGPLMHWDWLHRPPFPNPLSPHREVARIITKFFFSKNEMFGTIAMMVILLWLECVVTTVFGFFLVSFFGMGSAFNRLHLKVIPDRHEAIKESNSFSF